MTMMTMTKLKDNNPEIIWGMCIECDFEGHVDDFEYDYEYDEFSGNDRKYLVCPKCGGGVELSGVKNIVND